MQGCTDGISSSFSKMNKQNLADCGICVVLLQDLDLNRPGMTKIRLRLRLYRLLFPPKFVGITLMKRELSTTEN
jgi:hypothetical protein